MFNENPVADVQPFNSVISARIYAIQTANYYPNSEYFIVYLILKKFSNRILNEMKMSLAY